MSTDYFEDLDKEYTRNIFDLFINSSVSTNEVKNRKFSTVDMFPTTLASMGVKIEGDRLGLGTNLFSKKMTLIETHGKSKVWDELSTESKFYNSKFINNE